MERELSRKVSMHQAREATKRHFEAVFGVELLMKNLSELQDLLQAPFLDASRIEHQASSIAKT
jgi:lipoate-protein ligase A